MRMRGYLRVDDHSDKKFGEPATMAAIKTDLDNFTKLLNVIKVAGSKDITTADCVVQSGTVSTVWGCPLHFKEIEEENDHDDEDLPPVAGAGAAPAPPAPAAVSDPGRVNFDTGDLKMNDIDVWCNGMVIPQDLFATDERGADRFKKVPLKPNDKMPGGPKNLYSAGEDHLLVKKGFVFDGYTFNYEIEGYQFDSGKDATSQMYDSEKRMVWVLDASNAYTINPALSNNANVMEVSTTAGPFFTLGPVTGLMLKKKLVAFAPMKRGKGKPIDGAIKLYQDRFDVICLCAIQLRQNLGVASDMGGSYTGNNPLVAGKDCPDPATIPKLNEPVNDIELSVFHYNQCLNVDGLNNFWCAPSGQVHDAQRCTQVEKRGSLEQFFRCPYDPEENRYAKLLDRIAK